MNAPKYLRHRFQRTRVDPSQDAADETIDLRAALASAEGEATALRRRFERTEPPTDLAGRLAHAEARAEAAEAELAALRGEHARAERDARLRELQLERYADDLCAVFKEERLRGRELGRHYAQTVRALANALEKRDAYTGKHAERVTAYGLRIARSVGLRIDDVPQLEFGFLLHDVGKVAVPDSVLYKPGRLDDAEFALMARHPVAGDEILRHLDFLDDARLTVRNHHERWDGTGYPDRLAGEAIPLAARVFAVADALDALTTNRPYRAAASWESAREEILRSSGTHFDPAVVAGFERIGIDELIHIQEHAA
jgi:ribonuclease P protein subunit RPR2